MGVSPVDVHDNNPNDRTLIGWRQKVGIRGESGGGHYFSRQYLLQMNRALKI